VRIPSGTGFLSMEKVLPASVSRRYEGVDDSSVPLPPLGVA